MNDSAYIKVFVILRPPKVHRSNDNNRPTKEHTNVHITALRPHVQSRSTISPFVPWIRIAGFAISINHWRNAFNFAFRRFATRAENHYEVDRVVNTRLVAFLLKVRALLLRPYPLDRSIEGTMAVADDSSGEPPWKWAQDARRDVGRCKNRNSTFAWIKNVVGLVVTREVSRLFAFRPGFTTGVFIPELNDKNRRWTMRS